ncbi:HpcH/HpaI aldolase/citrate lyase family protein [Microbacterium luticocti]|uniref:HpcH/HpaI aldolase/citrate lyase family protein n=1 Tax=Microbacterium luticocti TaxID=451764 RepID=UPI000409C48E|nr:CoA ester lyase [Microbacterium luticocti]
MSFAMGPALLFCPADRPERYAKAAERADAVILDLEDAVSPDAKAAARGHVIESDLDPARTIVRINPLDSDHLASDLSTVLQTDYRTVMVAKAESAKRIGRLDPRLRVVALCETARGVERAEKIAALENVDALMWGAEDLVASLGGTSSRKRNGRYRDIARYARARVLLAAGAHGRAAVDAVHLDIADAKGLAREAEDAAATGFAATACIHPSQVEIIRAAYRPDADTVAWAKAVLAAAEGERGVFSFRGRMVDEPVLRHARAVLGRA